MVSGSLVAISDASSHVEDREEARISDMILDDDPSFFDGANSLMSCSSPEIGHDGRCEAQ